MKPVCPIVPATLLLIAVLQLSVARGYELGTWTNGSTKYVANLDLGGADNLEMSWRIDVPGLGSVFSFLGPSQISFEGVIAEFSSHFEGVADYGDFVPAALPPVAMKHPGPQIVGIEDWKESGTLNNTLFLGGFVNGRAYYSHGKDTVYFHVAGEDILVPAMIYGNGDAVIYGGERPGLRCRPVQMPEQTNPQRRKAGLPEIGKKWIMMEADTTNEWWRFPGNTAYEKHAMYADDGRMIAETDTYKSGHRYREDGLPFGSDDAPVRIIHELVAVAYSYISNTYTVCYVGEDDAGRQIEAKFAKGVADGAEVFAAVDVLLGRWGVQRVQDVYHGVSREAVLERSLRTWMAAALAFLVFSVAGLVTWLRRKRTGGGVP